MRNNISSRAHVPAASRPSWWAELTQNRIIALVLAMIIAVPLLAAPADHNLTGIAAITLESFALILMTALLWRAKWDLRAENVRRFFGTGANLPIVLLLGLMTLSCVLSSAKLFSIQELLRTGSGILLYFVVAYQFRQSKHLSLLVGVVLSLSALVAIGGMAQYQLFSEDRASAIFGNAQPLSSFVMLLLPVVAALAWTDKNPTRRNIAMIVAVLMTGCLMLTQGRSAWIGAAAGLLMLAYLVKQSSAPAKSLNPLRARKHQLVWPVLAAVVAIGFLVITKSQNPTLDNRATASTNLAKDGSWQLRLQSWKGTLQMIEAKPLTGWGTGLYPVYQHKFTGQGAVIAPDGAGVRVSLAEQAHNFYLQTAAELGIPGLLLTLATFGCFLSAGFSRVTQLEAGIRRTLLMGTMAATTAFLVDAISSPSWQFGQTSMFLWLMMGVGTSCVRPRVKREESVTIHAASRQFAFVSRPMAAGLFLLFITLLPTGYSSAQSFTYNDGSSTTTTEKVVYGTAAVAGVLYIISTFTESVIAGTVGAGAGAAGAGAAGAGAGAAGAGSGPTTSSGGFSSGTGDSATTTSQATTTDNSTVPTATPPSPNPTATPAQ